MNDVPPEVQAEFDRLQRIVTGDFMVAWAKENVTKSCGICHGARYFSVRRGSKSLQEVCGCAAKRFVRAFAGKVETRGDQLAWRKGFVPAPATPPG